MIYFCLMLKVGPKLSSHYHSVYQHECTARIQLAIRQAHADRNLEYWIESRTPEDTTPSGSVRFSDSNGYLIVDTQKIGEENFVRHLLTGAPLYPSGGYDYEKRCEVEWRNP